MKILQVTSDSPDLDIIGGRTKNIYRLSEYFSVNNIDNDIVFLTLSPHTTYNHENYKGKFYNNNVIAHILYNDMKITQKKSPLHDFYTFHFKNHEYKKISNDYFEYESETNKFNIKFKNGAIHFVKITDIDSNYSIYYFDEIGCNFSKANFNKNNSMISRKYFDENNAVIYSFFKFLLWNVYIFKNKNSKIKNFISLNPSKIKWQYLKSLSNKNDIIINSLRALDNSVYKARKKFKKVYLWYHNPHKKTHYLNGKVGQLLGSYQKGIKFAQKSKVSIFTLTKEQREDIMDEYNIKSKNIFVLPKVYIKSEFKDIDSISNGPANKIGMITRYFNIQKNIIRAISSFEIYNKKYKESHLYIWGVGEDFNMIKNYIINQKLDKVITLMGWSSDNDSTFSMIDTFLITSNYGGLDTTILESLSRGVRVVSSLYKYGPEELIETGKNGVLAIDDSPEMVADALSKVSSVNSNDVKKWYKDYLLKMDIEETEFLEEIGIGKN